MCAILIATIKGNIKILKIIIENGADIIARNVF